MLLIFLLGCLAIPVALLAYVHIGAMFYPNIRKQLDQLYADLRDKWNRLG